MDKVLFSSKSNEWETPLDFFNKIDNEFNFVLDAAATVENSKCLEFISHDSLDKIWNCGNGNIWLNPPYGRAIDKWLRKANREADSNNRVVCLVPARTDTKVWHEVCQYAEIRFIKGRLKFLQDGKQLAPAPFPSALVIFGNQPCVKWI